MSQLKQKDAPIFFIDLYFTVDTNALQKRSKKNLEYQL